MDNQILRALLAEYEQKRQANEREEARRRREIAENHPDLDQWLRRRHDMVMLSVRASFSGAAENAEAKMAEYNQKIAALLAEKGYPADYLAPVCQCAQCGDTGYIYDHSIQKPCPCLLRAYQEALSHAGQSARQQTFACFDESRFPDDPLPGTDVTQREYMRIVRNKCLAYAQGVPGGEVKTLLLHGGSGLGKTYLLNCVGNHARDRGVRVVSVTAYDLLMDLKTAYFSREGRDVSAYFEAPLLLIDDLGMEPLLEGVTVEQIYHLLNARLTDGLYTAISTNLGRTELKQKYTERVISRLLDARSSLAIAFQGKDIRLLR